ncbi:MAG: high-potential iron-sulfur protein [Betaproteobacteria bacterium]
MSDAKSVASRRRFFKITAIGLAAAPFANALMSGAAHAANAVKETDPTATALGYVLDASKSTKRTDKTAMCGNCSLFSGKPGAADGPCTIFQGNLVQAKGWCTAWVKKA